MRRPWILAAVAAVALVPSATADAAVVKKSLTFDVTTGPAGDVPCRITADLYIPDGASKAAPVPAILATNGFGGSKADFATLAPSYAKRGYAFLAYSGLGFGGSGCKITLDDRDHDGKAGSQLVSFLGGSKAATDGTKVDFVQRDAKDHDGKARDDDPRVGMIGGSYGGQIQFAVAGVDPRVDALNPQITWNDLSYSLTGNNTDFKTGVSARTPGVAKLDWPTLFTGVGVADGFQAALQDGDTSHLGACPNFADQVCPSLISSAARGYPDATTEAFLQHASVATYLEKIKVPTFLAQGEHDTLFDLQEAVATYKSLLGQGTPVKLLWRSAGHSGGSIGAGESVSSNPEAAYESRMSLEWFDWYLRGLGEPPALDFSFFRDWVAYKGDAAPAVGSTPSYPASTTTPLQLSGADALVPKGGAAAPADATFLVTPAPTSAGGAAFAGVPAYDVPGTFAAFATAPLAEDLDVVGVPSVTFSVDAPTFAPGQSADPASKLVLFAKLEDVDAAGNESVPGDIVSAARIADVTKPITIELPGIAHRFAKGHRLRLVITSSNLLRRGNVLAGPVTITSDPAAPSTLTLPKLGAPAGPAGSGPSGTSPFTASPEALPLQKAGAGGVAASGAGAGRLPGSRSCTSRRRFAIRLARPPRGDRRKTTTITVNGRRKVVVRNGRTGTVNLRGLPKGTFRVVVTTRTAKGRTLRSARTYRTCVAKRK